MVGVSHESLILLVTIKAVQNSIFEQYLVCRKNAYIQQAFQEQESLRHSPSEKEKIWCPNH